MISSMSFSSEKRSRKQVIDDLDFLNITRPVTPHEQTVKSRNQELNEKLDDLEAKIMAKAEVLSGFASPSGRVRHLFNVFKFYDQNNSGYINFPDFLDVLKKFNISGSNREAEELFNRYDENMLGHIDCKEFSLRLHKAPPYKRFSPLANQGLYSIRAALSGKYEYSGLRYFRSVMRLPSMDADGFVSLDDLVNHILPRTGKMVSRKSFILLLSELETRNDSRVSAKDFLNAIKSGMELYRKRLVRAVFDKIDRDGRGYVTETEVCACYQSSGSLPPLSPMANDSVSHRSSSLLTTDFGGDISSLLAYMQQVGVEQVVPSHTITWTAFLDYYRWISVSLELDADFEAHLRMTWALPLFSQRSSPRTVTEMEEMTSPVKYLLQRARPITPVTVKVRVTRTNGKEENLDVRDDLGTIRYSLPSLQKAVTKKGIHDIAKLTW